MQRERSGKSSSVDLARAARIGRRHGWVTCALLCAVCCVPAGRAARLAAGEIDFNHDIRPILSDTCYRCHGPDSGSREADLRLDREEDAKTDRDGTPPIVPNRASESELIRRITSKDDGERMPPADSGKTLTPAQIDLLTRWIDSGAAWSLPWAFVPPKRQPAPTVRDENWPAHWVDNFILARLEAEKLAPSPDADKVTLIRRLYVDLLGLPPQPADVDAFLADDSPQAIERVVNRLLSSPHYGERMAAYWLDLVRYADTVGYHGDQEHNISPYRDYVIAAFNENLPFDRFTREQLGGDLLPEPTIQQKIATGYNRVLQTSHEGGVQPKEYLAIYAADHVRNFSAVWLGGTMGCAQCHDHKFDPYTMKDFYSMQAFFADVDEAKHLKGAADRSPTNREPELELPTPEQASQIAALEAQIKELKAQREAAESEEKSAPEATAVAESEQDAGATQSTKPSDKKNKKGKPAPADPLTKEIAAREKELDSVRANVRRTMITVSIKPRTIRVLPRGNWLDDSGEIVEPAVPAFWGKLACGDRRATRLDLANWITDPREGIGGATARVMANRVWYLLFGAGLSRSLDDFGGQGEAPSHPELLDALACEFVDSGWDLKHLIKLIATSRAYRQASRETPALHERDPLNCLVARQASFRFPAEAVRDGALAISGLLVDRIGGPSARPYQPAGYYAHLNFPEREYQSDKDENQWRRGVYMHWQRQYLHPMLRAFDAPTREECTAQRPRSNTALAALVLLNDPTFVEASRAFAARILREGGTTTDERLAFAFRQAVSRMPEPEERQLLQALLDKGLKHYTSAPKDAELLESVGQAPPAEGVDRAEWAAWSLAARAILNMSETLTRN